MFIWCWFFFWLTQQPLWWLSFLVTERKRVQLVLVLASQTKQILVEERTAWLTSEDAQVRTFYYEYRNSTSCAYWYKWVNSLPKSFLSHNQPYLLFGGLFLLCLMLGLSVWWFFLIKACYTGKTKELFRIATDTLINLVCSTHPQAEQSAF